MTTSTKTRTGSPPMAIWKALLLSLPMFLITALLPLQALESGDLSYIVAILVMWLGFNVAFILMLTTGQTYRYRSVLFILLAVALPLWFIPMMIETHGSMMLSEEALVGAEANFCPLATFMVIVPALVKRIVIFPSALAGGLGFATSALMWAGSTLALGRGWCSWGCLFGGWDELFSRLRKRAVIKNIDRRWIYLPFGLLLAIVLLSAMTLSPIYCEWLCPFKIVTEFQAPTSLLAIIQITTFVVLFFALVVVLPLLTRRRIQCGLFCPFGALQSLLNKINVFEVRIDPEKCNQCKRCIRECPTFSLNEGSLESGKPLITCTKCARCIDICTKNAISFHIKGTSLQASPAVARVLYLYPGFVLLFFISSANVGAALHRIVKLITTGSMI
jgi:ferredoxin-type protein NapH